jgi:hypothetical protein
VLQDIFGFDLTETLNKDELCRAIQSIRKISFELTGMPQMNA